MTTIPIDCQNFHIDVVKGTSYLQKMTKKNGITILLGITVLTFLTRTENITNPFLLIRLMITIGSEMKMETP